MELKFWKTWTQFVKAYKGVSTYCGTSNFGKYVEGRKRTVTLIVSKEERIVVIKQNLFHRKTILN